VELKSLITTQTPGPAEPTQIYGVFER
jgi:hypothetical protein